MRPSSSRTLHLTPEHVARATRPVGEVSYPSAYVPATDAHYEALIDSLVAEKPPGSLHVFAYGSLIWNPTFEAAARRRAVARGWHRQFSLLLRGHRGTPEAPALMMTLMSGGCCVGLALEVKQGQERQVIGDALRREFPFVETLENSRWITMKTEAEPVRGLVFWAGPKGPGVLRGLPLVEAARRIARACGPRGSNAEYLRNTVASLEEHGIRDANLWRLQRLVAEEIDSF